MKTALRVFALLGLCLLVVYISSYWYRSSHTESIAATLVVQYCHDFGLDPKNLSGPVEGGVGNLPASYSWKYTDSTHRLELLVSFDSLYDPKIAIWDYNRKD